MEQQRALNALESYIALSKAANSARAAADLITQATSSPQTYVFAELLQTPNIQALRNSPEYISHLKLLEIFAWGTYSDYTATPNLPPLNPTQHEKLLLLSLLPLCSNPTNLTYSSLCSTLFPTSTPSDITLESLITTAIYAGLLTASLDPLHRTVRVTSVAPLRDLAPNSLPALVHSLDDWEARCADTLAEIEAQVQGIRKKAREDRIKELRRDKAFETAIEREDARDDSGGGGAAGGPGGVAAGAGGGSAAGNTLGQKTGKANTFNAGGSISKMFGLGSGRGGKRAAPGMSDAGGGGASAAMDVDEGGGARGSGRGVKRQGRGGRH